MARQGFRAPGSLFQLRAWHPNDLIAQRGYYNQLYIGGFELE